MNNENPIIDINGLAHVILTVSNFEKAHEFYSKLLPKFGMSLIHDGPDFCYHVGGRTAIGIRSATQNMRTNVFNNIAWVYITFASAQEP